MFDELGRSGEEVEYNPSILLTCQRNGKTSSGQTIRRPRFGPYNRGYYIKCLLTVNNITRRDVTEEALNHM
jgi:hypothetical protein